MKRLIARSGLCFFLYLFSTGLHAGTIGDLIISEFMANPLALIDREGEWIELYNPTDHEINLRDGWLGDDGNDLHRFETDLLIPPHEYLTLARSAAPGFLPDYVYTDFVLANGTDEIVFGDASGELIRFNYQSGFVPTGRSLELVNRGAPTDTYAPVLDRWVYGSGDIGTPGVAGQYHYRGSSIPVPQTAWLFVGGIAMLGLSRREQWATHLSYLNRFVSVGEQSPRLTGA